MDRFRRRRTVQLASLAVALGVAGWLVIAANPTGRPPAANPPAQSSARPLPKLTQTWPKASITSVSGRLPDGTAYLPWLYLNADVSVGTAPTPDKAAQRVLLREGTRPPTELHRVPATRFPQFLGFVADDDYVYWAEFTASDNGPSETRILRASWKAPQPPITLTTDTGTAVFFNSEHDLVIADGQVHWVANPMTSTPITELRSVPIGGGRVAVRPIEGVYQLSTWPWLRSAGGVNTPLHLLNPVTGQKVDVSTAVTELVTCSPSWCRCLVKSPTGDVTRFDEMRPDGSNRRRIAGPTASPATSDVGLLDRFEALTQGEGASQSLVLYDIQARTLTMVAENVRVVQARGGLLWWSTGEDNAEWHVIDLRALPT